MHPETKQESMTLPPGLPDLPPGMRYAGQLKDYEGDLFGFIFNPEEPEDGWVEGEWVGVHHYPEDESENWHVALPIESEAIPAAPPVVEEIDPAVRLNIAAQMMAAMLSGIYSNPAEIAEEASMDTNPEEYRLHAKANALNAVAMADALIAATRKGGNK